MIEAISSVTGGASPANFMEAIKQMYADKAAEKFLNERNGFVPANTKVELKATAELDSNELAQMGDVVSPYYSRRLDANGRTRIMRIWYA